MHARLSAQKPELTENLYQRLVQNKPPEKVELREQQLTFKRGHKKFLFHDPAVTI
jgi:hypothetical protein